MFSELDVQKMSGAFNLSSYKDVVANAAPILDRLKGIGGAVMPPKPEGPWPDEWIGLFERWVSEKCPE
jgi:hypothetical protein